MLLDMLVPADYKGPKLEFVVNDPKAGTPVGEIVDQVLSHIKGQENHPKLGMFLKDKDDGELAKTLFSEMDTL
jgi:hypothetical protein